MVTRCVAGVLCGGEFFVDRATGNIATNGTAGDPQFCVWLPGARANGASRGTGTDRTYPLVAVPKGRNRKVLMMTLGARFDGLSGYPVIVGGTDATQLVRVERDAYETVLLGFDRDIATLSADDVVTEYLAGRCALIAEGLPSVGPMAVPLDADIPPQVTSLVCITVGRVRLRTGNVIGGLGDAGGAFGPELRCFSWLCQAAFSIVTDG